MLKFSKVTGRSPSKLALASFRRVAIPLGLLRFLA